jgi:hypothetical protein
MPPTSSTTTLGQIINNIGSMARQMSHTPLSDNTPGDKAQRMVVPQTQNHTSTHDIDRGSTTSPRRHRMGGPPKRQHGAPMERDTTPILCISVQTEHRTQIGKTLNPEVVGGRVGPPQRSGPQAGESRHHRGIINNQLVDMRGISAGTGNGTKQ